nr:FAD-dependent oxidoreductase [uncultured Carboxylicivirga sp.]
MTLYNLEYFDKRCEFDSTYTFRFKSDESLNFNAGQWVHLGFPQPNRDKSLVRHMSFASAPSDKYLEFTMDISSKTAYKQKMNNLLPGDSVKAFKIVGEFQVLPQQKEIMFITGGIGITPVRSIIRQLKYQQSTTNWTLLHVSRGSFLYNDEISKYDNKQVRVNRSELELIWPAIIKKHESTQYYISGSEQFVKGISEKLTHSGITKSSQVVESFH